MKNLTFLNNQFSIDNDRSDQIELIKQLQEDINLNKMHNIGDKVKYLGHDAIITNVTDYNGRIYFDVKYNKGFGVTLASSICSTNDSITK